MLDFYHYYLRRIETRPDQRVAIQSCRDMALRLFETGPMTWAVASGAALLAALHEVKVEPGTDLVPTFREIVEALFAELQGVRLDLEMERKMAIQNTGCGRQKHRTQKDRKER